MLKPHHRICLAAFCLDFSVMIGMLVTPFFVFNQLHGAALMSGVFGAVYAASYAITCLVSSGFVSRSKNGIHWAVFGAVLFVTTFSIVPLFRNVILCGTLIAIANAALAFMWPALHSWIGAEPDLDKRGRYMAAFNISWSLGFGISPLLAGPLYDFCYWLPFVFLGLFGTGTLVLLLTLPHERDHFGVASEETLALRAGHDQASEVHLYYAWLACLMGNFLAGITRTVYPKRVDELVKAGELRLLNEDVPWDFLVTGVATKYSWLACALAISVAAVFLWMGHSRRWQHKFWILFLSQAFAAAAFWELGRTRSLLVMIGCFILVGLNCGATFFAAVYYSLADPAHKHRRAAINEGAVGVGGFLGSLLFGLMADRYGTVTPFHYTPILMAVALFVQYMLLKRSHSRSSVVRGV